MGLNIKRPLAEDAIRELAHMAGYQPDRRRGESLFRTRSVTPCAPRSSDAKRTDREAVRGPVMEFLEKTLSAAALKLPGARSAAITDELYDEDGLPV